MMMIMMSNMLDDNGRWQSMVKVLDDDDGGEW